MDATRERERTAYFDILRVIAMLAVITIHVSAQNWYSTDVRSFSWRAFNFYDSIARYGVPIFVMISGALFLDPERTVTLQKLHRKNIQKMLLVYITWAAFYALFTFLTGEDDFSLSAFFAAVITGHYHMWFLPLLVGLYLITPPLRKVTADPDTTKYLLALSFLFAVVIPSGFLFIQQVGIRDGVYTTFDSLYSNLKSGYTIGIVFYYILGYCMNKATIGKRCECVLYLLGFLGFASTIILSRLASLRDGAPVAFYSEYMLNVCFETISVFTFAKCRLSKWLCGKRVSTVIRKLSKYSFGVYLIHPFFITCLAKLGLDTLRFNAALSVPLVVAATFALSLISSVILNHIPIVKKYFV